ncbi:MAG: right-handed parallel beta-helix repeat-containing protein, partial [Planctomycetes bacterium]|nr:right-handed parallel beta-helix repeat-containing protein [Planctomycetota bacterium]
MKRKDHAVCTCVWISMLILFVAPDLLSRTIVVAKDGSGDYRYLQPAVDNAVAGDTVEVHPGLYLEYLIPESGISIIGTSAYDVVIRDRRALDVIALEGVENVHLANLTLAHLGGPTLCSSPAITISKCADILIEGCDIIGCGREGVWCLNSSQITIRNNRIYDNVQRGIGLIETTDFTVENNVIFDNHAGIEIVGGNGRVHGNTIVNHEQYSVYISGTKAGDARVSFQDNILSGAVYGLCEAVPEGHVNEITCTANCFFDLKAGPYAWRQITQREMEWWNNGPVGFFLTEGPEYLFFSDKVVECINGGISFR